MLREIIVKVAVVLLGEIHTPTHTHTYTHANTHISCENQYIIRFNQNLKTLAENLNSTTFHFYTKTLILLHKRTDLNISKVLIEN